MDVIYMLLQQLFFFNFLDIIIVSMISEYKLVDERDIMKLVN